MSSGTCETVTMSIYVVQVLLQRVQLVFLPQVTSTNKQIQFHQKLQEVELGTPVNQYQQKPSRDELAFLTYLKEKQDFVGGLLQIIKAIYVSGEDLQFLQGDKPRF
ncbi:hypothetical protein TGCAST_232770 [Toxoplasma gondii CAST]|uniref:Uncharacterized protein n=1 Tax=Toxoplasma gondii CAST TaxID=943122 RepID=A0A3R8C4A4_TOXGO|nr:hypothetical protein TGCAST_232770 [Toxoplasma gondii CAST]